MYQSTIYVIISFLVQFIYVSCGTVEPSDGRNKIYTEGKSSITLSWNITASAGEKIFSFYMKSLDGGLVFQNTVNLPINYIRELDDGNRLEYNHVGNQAAIVKLLVNDLEYGRPHKYTIEVKYGDQNRNKTDFLLTEHHTITVSNSKYLKLCKEDIPSMFEVAENERTLKSLYICGYPMPFLSWQVGMFSADKMKGVLVNSTTALYNYTFILPKFYRSYCCRNIRMTINGYNGSIIERNIQLKMKADPPIVRDIQVHPVGDCSVITWRKESIGECVIQYKIELSQQKNIKVFTTTASEIKICDFKTNAANIRIWSVYDGRNGNISEYLRLERKEIKQEPFKFDTESIAAITLGSFALLAIIITIFMVTINSTCLKRKENKHEPLVKMNRTENQTGCCCIVFKKKNNERQFSSNINHDAKKRMHMESIQNDSLKKQLYTDLYNITDKKEIYTGLELKKFGKDTLHALGNDTYVDIHEISLKMGYRNEELQDDDVKYAYVKEDTYDDVKYDNYNYVKEDAYDDVREDTYNDIKDVSYDDVRENMYDDVKEDTYDDVDDKPIPPLYEVMPAEIYSTNHCQV